MPRPHGPPDPDHGLIPARNGVKESIRPGPRILGSRKRGRHDHGTRVENGPLVDVVHLQHVAEGAVAQRRTKRRRHPSPDELALACPRRCRQPQEHNASL